jgi:uncharacterized protein (TIGR00369 family)
MVIAAPDELSGLRCGLGPDGRPIPAYRTLGLELRSATAGAAVARLPVSRHLASPAGDLLPGAFAVLADACCGCAVATALRAGGATVTAQLRVEFIRPLPPGHAWIEGRAEADAVDDDGGLARGEIVDETDQLLGVASLRLMKASRRGFRDTAATGGSACLAPAADGTRSSAAPAPATDAAARGTTGNPARRFPGVVSRQADSGGAVWTLRPPPGTANSHGMVHGGVLGLLAHQVASDAQRSLLGPGEQLIPLDLVVNYYRGVPASGRLVAATAQVTHRGRRFVVSEGEVTGPDGKPALRLSAGAQIRGTPAR